MERTKMTRLWHCLLPFATDCEGVYSLLADSDSVVIGQDRGGSPVRCREFSEDRPDLRAHFAGVHLNERDVVIGRPEKQMEEFYKALEGKHPEQIALTGTPVSSMLAIDLDGLGRVLEKKTGIPVLSFPTTGGQWYDRGMSQAFLRIYRRLSRELPPAGESSVSESEQEEKINLLGLNAMDWPDTEVRDTVIRVFEEDGYTVASVWGVHSGLSQWKNFSGAGRNVVCSVSGLALAEAMKKERGIPYTMLYEDIAFRKYIAALIKRTGLRNSGGTGIPLRILIIGEQVTSHTLRLLLEEAFPEISVSCAGFFERSRSMERTGDLYWKTESDFQEHLENHSYDFIIGDPVLRLAAGETQTFVPFIHPPVSGRYAEQFGGIAANEKTVINLLNMMKSRKGGAL
jgi:hypothetical protein